MPRIPAIICLDVEDPITMRSHRATEWVTSDIAAHGLRASCFLVAEKVRQWERLGLRSVIEAVKRHDLGFHSSRHSFHPAVSEMSEALPARTGAEMLWGWERVGWEQANRIMGKPLYGWGRSGGSWSPALAVMLGMRGHALMYSCIHGDDPWRPCWFAGGLNFPQACGGLDAAYHDDAAYADALAAVKRQADEGLAAGAPCLPLFCCHPTRVVHHEFWDVVNFGRGRITVPEQWIEPDAITAQQEQTARRNLNDFIASIAGDARLEVIGFSELSHRFNAQKPGCRPSDLLAICGRIAGERAVIFTNAFSAAEIMMMMLEYAVEPGAEMLGRSDLLGPDSMPTCTGSKCLTSEETIALAAAVRATALANRYLPDTVATSDGTLSTADYFVALADALIKRSRGKSGPVICSAAGPYPAIGDCLARNAKDCVRSWRIHREDLDTAWIERDTRLLSWTFKPAWTVEELAVVE